MMVIWLYTHHLGKFLITTGSPCSPEAWFIMVRERSSPEIMAQQFRLVKYYFIYPCIYIYITIDYNLPIIIHITHITHITHIYIYTHTFLGAFPFLGWSFFHQICATLFWESLKLGPDVFHRST